RELPHVCPADVFEVLGGPPDAVRVAVHGDRCIRCEACWRFTPSVDWGTDSLSGGLTPPEIRQSRGASAPRPEGRPATPNLSRLLDQRDGKLSEFEKSLTKGPATIDRSRGDYLEMLARYAQQLAVRIQEILRETTWPINTAVKQQALELAAAVAAKTEERA